MGYLDDEPIKKGKSKKRQPIHNADWWLSKNRGKKKKKNCQKKFATPKYHEYMRSVHWKIRREQYFNVHDKKCWICGSSARLGLHHLHYKNLGREKDDDLIALCWDHHERLHDIAGHNQDKAMQFIDQEKAAEEFYQIFKTL